jgi:hypothetical protein
MYKVLSDKWKNGGNLLSRVERFKEIRKFKRKLIFTFMFSLFLLLTGTSVTDYSINNLMKNEKGLNIVSYTHHNHCLEISIMGYKMHIDTTYIKRDYDNVKDFLLNFFRHVELKKYSGQGLPWVAPSKNLLFRE